MITYVNDNLFTSPARVLVNAVNTVGVMGKGIAKLFKDIYPEMFTQYQKLCESGRFQPGNLWLYKTPHKWVLNFPTKQHWRQPSKIEYIESGLRKFVASYSDLGITSVAFPALGCGNGELNWDDAVKPIMLKYLGQLPIDIFIYRYNPGINIPEHHDIEAMQVWLRSEPYVLAFGEVWEDLSRIIGIGRRFNVLHGDEHFIVTITEQPEIGLLLEMGSVNVLARLVASVLLLPKHFRLRVLGKSLFIPRAMMLDLWQNIRGFGFCVPVVMPAGFDALYQYMLPLLAELPYMKPVELRLATRQGTTEPVVSGLKLFVRARQQGPSLLDPAYAV